MSEVRTTHRLTTSPACLVAKDSDLGANFERLLQAAGQSVELAKPVLEINPSHPLLARYRSEKSESRRKDWAELLVDQATLAEGGRLADPGEFVSRLNQVLLALADTPSRRNRSSKKKAAKKSTARDAKAKEAELSGAGRKDEATSED